jgi:hypothetical protein
MSSLSVAVRADDYDLPMNTADALADIDAVLANPSNDTLKDGIAMVTVEQVARYQACIYRNAPPGSTYRTQADRYAQAPIERGAVRFAGGAGPEKLLKGVLSALRSDIANGRLKTFEELVRADVYADLIAQGAGLVGDGYSRAATVVVGAALEEHLKKLAVKNQLPVLDGNGRPKKASEINADLRRANIYGEAQRASIEAWQKLRNDAAHGQPGFDGSDTSKVALVGPMIDGVRAFVAQHGA